MNSESALAAELLARLEALQGFGGLFLRFSSFLQPFEDFIFIDQYNPAAVKQKAGKKKKVNAILTKEIARPLAKQFYQFICNVLKLLPDLLKRSSCNGAEVKEGMQAERAAELLGIYRLTIHCFLCIAPCLTGQPYSVHLQWGQLVRRLESWNNYNNAEEEALSLLESLYTLLVTPPSLRPTLYSLPHPSDVGSAGSDSQLAILINDMVIILTYCSFKSQSRDADAYKRILVLVELVQPWICIIEPNTRASRHTILVDALHKCALFLAGENKSFDDDLVYSFCLKMLKECIESPLVDRFPIISYRICYAIDVTWNRRHSLVLAIINMSMEDVFCWSKVDLAKYMKELLDFISICVEGFNIHGRDTIKGGSQLSLEQVSTTLELCCKTIWKHIQLLCQSLSENFKGFEDCGASKDLLNDIIGYAFTKCARIVDALHKIGAIDVRKILIKCIFELSIVEASFPNMFCSFPLVKQWVKMLCRDCCDANEVECSPFLYSLLLCNFPTLPKKYLAEILQQELLAYDQLETSNPALCHKMEMRVIDRLLMDVLVSKDFNLQRARVLVRKAWILRSHGLENLSSCFDTLTEAISLLENAVYDSSEVNALRHNQLASAYFMRAQILHEIRQNWELIQNDIQCGINLLSKLDVEAYHTLKRHLEPSAKSTIIVLCHILDFLSLKGLLMFHFDMHALICIFCKFENMPMEKCLAMLWSGRRLGHSLCSSPIHPDLVSRISQLSDDNVNSFTFWTECLKNSSYLLLIFIQKIWLSDSILNEEHIKQIESLYNCTLSIEDVKIVASSLLLDGSTKSEKLFFAGRIYNDLAERLLACGRVIEALSFAKEALNLHYKVLRKKFLVSRKISVEPTESTTTRDEVCLELLGSAVNEIWRDSAILERCVVGPWSILNCYLESILQVGILHEAIGDGAQAESLFLMGKKFSVLQSLPNFQIAFSCALGQIYCKKLMWDMAENELSIARKLLLENNMLITCKQCRLIFDVTIDMINGDISSMKPSNKGTRVQTHALDIYKSALEKLSNDKLKDSCNTCWNYESACESLSKCHIEKSEYMAIKSSYSHPLESNRSLTCPICSFFGHNIDAQNVEQQNTTRATTLSLGTERGEPHMQKAIKKKFKDGLNHLSKATSFNTELKPRRSSRIRSFQNKRDNISTQNEDCGSASRCVVDTTIESQIKDVGTSSYNFGCSYGDICSKIECLRCIYFKIIKGGTIEEIIYFKWQCQRRRLLLELLLKIANSLEAPGEMQGAHEVHGVFWRCISVLFEGKPCFNDNAQFYDLNLFNFIGDNTIGVIFSVERAALLYTMSWFFLKDFHPDRRSKCCSLSNVKMQDIISWLLRAFILCREIPMLSQKVSRLIATLILLSTVDDSISPSLCSHNSLSLNHWAAFFHQASIGSLVNNQYLSFVRDKAGRFKAFEGLGSCTNLETEAGLNYISRNTPINLEKLGEFVEIFYNDLPKMPIICISLLGGDYVNLLGEVLILPSFFPAWLLITRFDSNRQPIIMFLPVDSISEDTQPNINLYKEFTSENKLSVSNWPCPWSGAVIDDVAPLYRHTLETNYSSLADISARASEPGYNFSKWWSSRMNLDKQLESLLKVMENRWIGPWGCLFLGERLNAKSMEMLASRMSGCLNSQYDFKINDNLIKIILSGAQSVAAAESCISQSLLYKEHFGRGECCGEQRFRAFSEHTQKVKSMLKSIHSLVLGAVDEECSTVDRQPIILILDADVQMMSWENMPMLRNQEVYRMPSLGSTLLKLSLHAEKKSIYEDGLPCIDPFLAYYVLNPDGDLSHTQQQFEELFQNKKWEGKAGDAPSNDELLIALQNHDLYLYFGHGSGMQYVRAECMGKLERCAAAVLMGCSSGSLRQRGCYAPQGAPLHYLYAGSPAVMANLWEVTDKDIDRFAKAIISSWTDGHDDHDEAALRFASCISSARKACKLPSIIGASVVCYGIPTLLKR